MECLPPLSELRLLPATEADAADWLVSAVPGRWQWQPRSGRLAVDQATLRLLGYQVDQLKMVPRWDQLIHPADQDRLLSAWRNASCQGWQLGLRLRTRRGRWGCVGLRARAANADGVVSGVVWPLRTLPVQHDPHFPQVLGLDEAVLLHDVNGAIVAWNAPAERLLGMSGEQLRGRSLTDPCWRTLDEDGRPLAIDSHPLWLSRAASQPCRDMVLGLLRPDGRWVWLSLDIEPVQWPGSRAVSMTTLRDITAERCASEARRLAAAVFEQARGSITICDPAGRLARVSQPIAAPPIQPAAEALLPEPAEPASVGRRHSQPTVAAYCDALTQLPNRLALLDAIQAALHQADNTGGLVGVAFIDLDRFRGINDRWGHAVGDLLLMEVAQRIRALLRSNDMVARLGGDEFALLFDHAASWRECVGSLERVLIEVARPVLVESRLLRVTASIGLTVYPDDRAGAIELLRHAEHAMQSAKLAGGDRYGLSRIVGKFLDWGGKKEIRQIDATSRGLYKKF
ncbi:diguanylate cyclase domain-containing protein [Chitinimonas lacunae]|uniref:Diguanylate cyclase domain-containing protein n=1 Tax=Chitinimonas lacunae TaxID=1963018 RepID=A0ABV8MV29_9NEIS